MFQPFISPKENLEFTQQYRFTPGKFPKLGTQQATEGSHAHELEVKQSFLVIDAVQF